MSNLEWIEELQHQNADLSKKVERLQRQLNDAVVILRRFERVTPFVIGGKYLQADLERFYKKWGVK